MRSSRTDSLRPATVDALEGWRGVACLLVVLYHCGLNLGVSTVVLIGSTGVHMFFVLSGYLLFRPYARAWAAGRPLPSTINFYARRLVRIVPPYAVSLVAFVALRAASGTKPPTPFNIAAHATLVFNYFPRIDLFSINPVLWSLAIEAQFYLLLPVVCLMVAAALPPGRRSRVAGAACVGLLATAGVAARWAEVRHFELNGGLTAGPTDVAFRTVFSYLDLFACGMAVACLPATTASARPAILTPIAALTAVAMVLAANRWCWTTAHGSWQHGGSARFLVLYPILVGVPVAVLLVMLTRPAQAGPAWLARGPLRWIGEISYSLYLYHVGVQFAASKLHLFDGRSYRFQSIANALLTTPAAVAVAAVMYAAVERPSIRWVARLRGTRPPSATGGATVPAMADPSVVLLGP